MTQNFGIRGDDKMIVIKQQRKVLLALVLCILILNGCNGMKERMVSPPLRGVVYRMEEYRYWTQRLTAPQAVLITPEDIDSRNELLMGRKDLYIFDIFNLPDALSKEEIMEMLEMSQAMLQRDHFDHLNHPMEEGKRDELKKQLNLEAVPSSKRIQWAMTLRECDIRALPTNEVAMKYESDYEFDHFQYTKIDPGEALAIIHHSSDGRWSFVTGHFFQGWIENDDIVLAEDKERVLDFFKASPFVIYTGESIHLYYDSALSIFAMKLRMGMRLPLVQEEEDCFCVRIPFRGVDGYLTFTEGYLPRDASVHTDYLLFTQENIARLAFGLLGSHYGWGGMFEGRDCSRVIFDIFRCTGLLLPRNSASQSQAGSDSIDLVELPPAQREALIIEKGIPFATLLNLKGHVMLYIGNEKGKAYVIHSLWAYRENFCFKDRLRKVARVVVSDLHLGEGSKKGSLLDRLSGMTFLVSQ